MTEADPVASWQYAGDELVFKMICGGSVISVESLSTQPLPSVTVTVYMPGHKLVGVADVLFPGCQI